MLNEEMMTSFTETGVPLESIVDFGSDGCNSRMGRRNSVSSRVEKN